MEEIKDVKFKQQGGQKLKNELFKSHAEFRFFSPSNEYRSMRFRGEDFSFDVHDRENSTSETR